MEEFLVPLFLFGGLVIIFAGCIMMSFPAVVVAGCYVFGAGLLSVLFSAALMITL